MSKKWKEIGNNGLVGAAKHSLAELKAHLEIKRMKPEKSVKEDKTKEVEAKKERKNGIKAKKKRSETKERD